MKIPGSVWVIVTLLIGAVFLFVLVSNKNNQIYKDVKLPIEVEVFVDYNCPHCANYDRVIDDVKSTYGTKINLQTKNLPFLDPSTSTIYAEAAEAARLQNKFDEYHKGLFKWVNYKKSPESAETMFTFTEQEKAKYGTSAVDIFELAKFLGLDEVKFKTDYESATVKAAVQSQKSDAIKRLGGPSTPAVFIFGQKMDIQTIDLKAKLGELIQIAESKK